MLNHSTTKFRAKHADRLTIDHAITKSGIIRHNINTTLSTESYLYKIVLAFIESKINKNKIDDKKIISQSFTSLHDQLWFDYKWKLCLHSTVERKLDRISPTYGTGGNGRWPHNCRTRRIPGHDRRPEDC